MLSATPEMDFTEYDKNHHRNAHRGGRWKENPDAVMEILASKDRAQAGYTAPACGLRLEG